jgi:hypothetical protein
MTPLLITSRPFRDSLWSPGVRHNENVIVRQRNPGDVDEELFFEYISNVFIPSVGAVRSHPELETETAILLMDSALSHSSRDFTSSRSLFFAHCESISRLGPSVLWRA